MHCHWLHLSLLRYTHIHTLSRLWSIFTAVMLAVSRSFFQVTMMEDMCAKASRLPVISFEFKTHMFPKRHQGERRGGVRGSCGGLIETFETCHKNSIKEVHQQVQRRIRLMS